MENGVALVPFVTGYRVLTTPAFQIFLETYTPATRNPPAVAMAVSETKLAKLLMWFP